MPKGKAYGRDFGGHRTGARNPVKPSVPVEPPVSRSKNDQKLRSQKLRGLSRSREVMGRRRIDVRGNVRDVPAGRARISRLRRAQHPRSVRRGFSTRGYRP